MSIQYVRSKWLRTEAVARDRRVRAYVPETAIFTAGSLTRMLNRYNTVYVKPDHGNHGTGVMRVWRSKAGGKYSVQSGSRTRSYGSVGALYTALQAARIGRQRYLVQRGIRLCRYEGRPFDLRIMVQSNPEQKWEVTGMLARVAGSRGVVTNVRHGGSVVSMDRVCRSIGMNLSQIAALRGRLRKVGLRTSSAMLRRFKRIKELGLDVGLDESRRPWIIEVNTSPDLSLFLRVKDHREFRKMYKYALAYGKKFPPRKPKRSKK